MSSKEKFEIANDLDFWDACMDFYDGNKPLQRNPLQMIGDRIRLIECLEAKGFTIVKIKDQQENMAFAEWLIELKPEISDDLLYINNNPHGVKNAYYSIRDLHNLFQQSKQQTP